MQEELLQLVTVQGDLIKIAPPFPRKNVFDAVCDQIKNLYPTLFATETKQVLHQKLDIYL